jgi:hypothetical protein
MSAATCPHCAAPAVPGAVYCYSCGGRLGSAPSAADRPPVPSSPLPSASAAGASPFVPGPAPVAPPPRRRRRWVLVVVVLAVIGIVVAAVVLYESAAPSVQVASILVYAPDDVCGLGVNLIGYYGFNASTGENETFELEVPNYNSSACTLTGVTTNTSGFALSDLGGLPLQVEVGSYGNFTVSITMPSSAFSGNLNLIYR